MLHEPALVVIGGGQAAAQLTEVARQEGYRGRITMLCDEHLPPYQRPPLSKQYLGGGFDLDWLLYRPRDFYRKFDVDLRLGTTALRIDRANRVIETADGQTIPYDCLALATGTSARVLRIPGGDGPRVFSIRNHVHVERLRPQLATPCRVAIIGAGFIGLETAAVLIQRGHSVTLFAQHDRILPRLGAEELSHFLLDRHRAHGVEFVFQVDVCAIEDDAQGLTIVMADGTSHGADIAIVGIGAIPNIGLAEAAGLQCEDGIVVDQLARTSDSAIVAAGDCTNHPSGHLARRVRLETVHNAVEQGRTAGATLAGKEMPYIQVPWVWSDQYKFRIQSVGVANGCDRTVVRGSPAQGRFSLFHFREDQLLAAVTVNQPHIFGATRRLLNERIPLSPVEAADPAFDIRALPASRASMEFDTPWPNFPPSANRVIHWGHS